MQMFPSVHQDVHTMMQAFSSLNYIYPRCSGTSAPSLLLLRQQQDLFLRSITSVLLVVPWIWH